MEKTERFARIYYVAGVIGILLFLLRVDKIDQDWYIQLGLILAWMLPPLIGGVIQRFRMSLIVVVLYFTFMAHESFLLYYWLYTAPSLEGPNGEGSPLGSILGVTIASIITVLPWVFALYRGWVAILEDKT